MEQDEGAARELYRAAAELGHTPARVNLARVLTRQGHPTEAAEQYRKGLVFKVQEYPV